MRFTVFHSSSDIQMIIFIIHAPPSSWNKMVWNLSLYLEWYHPVGKLVTLMAFHSTSASISSRQVWSTRNVNGHNLITHSLLFCWLQRDVWFVQRARERWHRWNRLACRRSASWVWVWVCHYWYPLWSRCTLEWKAGHRFDNGLVSHYHKLKAKV